MRTVICLLLAASGLLQAAEVWEMTPEAIKLNGTTQMTKTDNGYHLSADARVDAKETITVDPDTVYTIKAIARRGAGASSNATFRVVLEMIGKDGQVISPASLRIASGDLGELMQNAEHGNSELKIKGAEKWISIPGNKVLAFYAKADKSDLPNTVLSPRIKSISPDGTVVLTGIMRRKIPAGTLIRCHQETASFETVIRDQAPAAWKNYSVRFQGVSKGITRGQFNAGTTAFRLRIINDGIVDIQSLTVNINSINREVTFGTNARPDLVAQVKAGKIQEAKLLWWGEPDGDVTARLQDALTSGARKLIIDKTAKPWVTEPVILSRNDFELVFADGAELFAKRGSYQDPGDTVLTLRGCRNVVVRGVGKGGTIRMYKKDYQDPKKYMKGEWRNCISICGGENILIENLRVEESGGDGIYIVHNGDDFPKHIVIRKVDSNGNHRQGLSIISGTDILIENSIFRNTRGTNPESGIDVESNKADDPLRKIIIRNCKLLNNAGCGLIISATRMDSRVAGPLDITMEKCRVVDNQTSDFTLTTRSRWIRYDETTEGVVNVQNCVFENTKHQSPRRWPINLDFDVHHKITVNFKNLTVKRGPAPNGAVCIAHCLPDAKHPIPQSCVHFRNFRAVDVPRQQLLQFADHSFSGRKDLVTGIPFTPVMYPKISAVQFHPQISGIGVDSLQPVYQVLKADFWIAGTEGNKVVFKLHYDHFSRNSRASKVTLISPAGQRSELGEISPGKTTEFSFMPASSGVYKIEIRGGLYPKIALHSSNMPAGVLADPVDTILFDVSTLYFRVTKNAPPFAVRIWGRSNLLGVKAEIYDSQGTKVFQNDFIREGVQYTPSAAERARDGVWKIVLSKPNRGSFAKYHICLPGASPYLGIRPDCVPEIK